MTAERPSAEERAARGKAVRKEVPLDAHAEVGADASRDPIGLLLGQAEGRVPELVPIRHGRMLVSPFTFYRGAALIMASDLARTPATGVPVQLCGDAHLSNFGAYASPERRLVFDINDFDETQPGPFEWDVKRLATSFVVAGRANGFSPKHCRKAARRAVKSYRKSMRAFARQSILAVWYARLDVEDTVAQYKATLSRADLRRQKSLVHATESRLAKAYSRDNLQAVGKLTKVVDGQRRIVSNPPLVVPIDELDGVDGFDTADVFAALGELFIDYRATLQSDRGHLLDHFRLTDVAHKVVGVGSVGTRAWVLLLESTVADEALLLQAKQAGPSVLSAYAGPSAYTNHGERVVSGQRLMQATSDIFLGWLRATVPGEDYYLRQLRDWKMSTEIAELRPQGLDLYAGLCGWTLARAHARSGDRFAIAAYLGKSARFDHAVAEFAETYADLNERDHAALADAVKSGTAEARTGL
ncbi:DUF2252 domain-containing protein [Kribbella sp. NPDC049227]|uniref:DUF2252 domain-containing protein n=1 Tax=Kribbella sp. NPDC049227 TaxID=3364113 RepID=UPI00372381DE